MNQSGLVIFLFKNFRRDVTYSKLIARRKFVIFIGLFINYEFPMIFGEMPELAEGARLEIVCSD